MSAAVAAAHVSGHMSSLPPSAASLRVPPGVWRPQRLPAHSGELPPPAPPQSPPASLSTPWGSSTYVKVARSCPTLCDPMGCPWGSPGQSTGVGSLVLLQGIFPTRGQNRGVPRCRRTLYQLSCQGSPVQHRAPEKTSGVRLCLIGEESREGNFCSARTQPRPPVRASWCVEGDTQTGEAKNVPL